MKYLRKFSILLLMPAFFTVFVSAEGNNVNIITGVQITCHKENIVVTRQYIQPHKISAVLNYLRLLKCSGKADTDPEQLTGDSFEIILQDAAGQRSIYRQRANRFISKNSKPWEQVSPKQASRLYPLIQAMPTDLPPQ